jgi:ABC-type amino acid transport system permease subunit
MDTSNLLSPRTREKIPAIIFQLAIILFLAFVSWQIVLNAQANLDRLGISAGFFPAICHKPGYTVCG